VSSTNSPLSCRYPRVGANAAVPIAPFTAVIFGGSPLYNRERYGVSFSVEGFPLELSLARNTPVALISRPPLPLWSWLEVNPPLFVSPPPSQRIPGSHLCNAGRTHLRGFYFTTAVLLHRRASGRGNFCRVFACPGSRILFILLATWQLLSSTPPTSPLPLQLFPQDSSASTNPTAFYPPPQPDDS